MRFSLSERVGNAHLFRDAAGAIAGRGLDGECRVHAKPRQPVALGFGGATGTYSMEEICVAAK